MAVLGDAGGKVAVLGFRCDISRGRSVVHKIQRDIVSLCRTQLPLPLQFDTAAGSLCLDCQSGASFRKQTQLTLRTRKAAVLEAEHHF